MSLQKGQEEVRHYVILWREEELTLLMRDWTRLAAEELFPTPAVETKQISKQTLCVYSNIGSFSFRQTSQSKHRQCFAINYEA